MKIVTKNNNKLKWGSIIQGNALIGNQSEYMMIVRNPDGKLALVDLVRGVIKSCTFTQSELTKFLLKNPYRRIYEPDEIKLILDNSNN